MSSVLRRRRVTAILETPQGILVVAGHNGTFILPGGEANKHESRFVAALRELTEETSLRPYEAKIIFNHLGHAKPTFSGKGKYQDHHTVCQVKATGTIRLRDDAKMLAYVDPNTCKGFDPFNPGKQIRISHTTIEIIEKYRKWKISKQEIATDEDTSDANDVNQEDMVASEDND